jgi:NADPH:quinone reductase-like Zn-dependent oxidoreductase
MQAAIRDEYGSPDVVRVEDIATPTPVGDEVLVRVHAASVNRADLDNLYPRWAFLRLLLGLRRPRNRRIGLDVAGVVEAVGPDAARLRVGDRVLADLYEHGLGALAEYVCAKERAFLPMRDELSFDDAATLPHSAVLAIQGLRLGRGRRSVGPGDHVLIVGASGNVGPFAVQLAKHAGATVTGVCRTEKMDFVRAQGADEVIDYTVADPLTTGGPYDWILDVDGNVSLSRSRTALRPGGVYLTLGGTGRGILSALIAGPLLSRFSGGRRVGLLLGWKPFAADDVATLQALVADGTLRPPIDRRYPLAEVAEALRHLDEGRSRGKVLVIPPEIAAA